MSDERGGYRRNMKHSPVLGYDDTSDREYDRRILAVGGIAVSFLFGFFVGVAVFELGLLELGL